MDRGLTDIGLLLEPISVEKYEFIRLNKSEQWVVAMSPDCPLAQKKFITPEDLKDFPVILPSRLDVQSELAAWFGDDLSKLNTNFSANLPSAFAPLVHKNLGCALTVLGTVGYWNEKDIVYRPLKPKLETSSVLAWKKGKPFGTAATRFMEFARANIKEFI